MRALLFYLTIISDASFAGGLGTIAAPDGRFTLAVTSDQIEDGLTHNRQTTLQVRILPSLDRNGDSRLPARLGGLEFVAKMRDYDISTILNAKVTEIEPLHYTIDGVKLHIPGYWQIQFLLNVDEDVVVLEKTVLAKPPPAR